MGMGGINYQFHSFFFEIFLVFDDRNNKNGQGKSCSN